jgi:hypothetical protein
LGRYFNTGTTLMLHKSALAADFVSVPNQFHGRKVVLRIQEYARIITRSGSQRMASEPYFRDCPIDL